MDDAFRVEEGRPPPNPGRVEVTSPGNCKLSAMRQFREADDFVANTQQGDEGIGGHAAPASYIG